MKELSEKAKALKLGVYQHFKGGQYRVIGVAFHSETLEELVVYQALEGQKYLAVRPLQCPKPGPPAGETVRDQSSTPCGSGFIENVTRDGKTFPRFRYISS